MEAKEALGEEEMEQYLAVILTMRLEEEEEGAQCGSAAVWMLLLQEEAVVVAASTQAMLEAEDSHLLLRVMWEGSAVEVFQAALRLMLLRHILV